MIFYYDTCILYTQAHTLTEIITKLQLLNSYRSKYGLFHVDFNNPNRIRTPKKSVSWMTQVMHTRQVQPIN